MHSRIIVAGTFDRLHPGRECIRLEGATSKQQQNECLIPDESMLRTAFANGQRAEVWVTDDVMSASKGGKLGQKIQPFADRVAKLISWCNLHGYDGRYTIHELHDGYGDSVVDGSYTAIVCSEESRAGCDAINAKRALIGLPELEVVVAPLITDSAGEKISSTRLRAASTGKP